MKRPPLWLAASALSAGITVVFGIQRWLSHFTTDPYAEDTRVWLVAARIGMSHGWSRIYDVNLERAESAGFGPVGSVIDALHLYLSPPPAAWLIAPLALLPIPAAYVIWTLINLGAFSAVCWFVSRGSTLVRLTILLVSLGLYPVHYEFWQGQWVVPDLVFVGLAWLAMDRDRKLLAGALLAIPFFFKPQDVALLPLALLVSGRWRPLVGFVVVGAVLGAASLASLGTHGVQAWLDDIQAARTNAFSGAMTYTFLFGRGPLATAVEIGLGLTALALAWYRRERLDLVFALGIVASTASAAYLHEDDITILVVAAWIVLAGRPSVVQRLWLLVGIAAAQFISLGLPIPMLLWEAAWIAVLGLEPVLAARTHTVVAPLAEPVRT